MPKTRPGDEQNIASFAVDLICALGASKVFTLTGGMAMYLNRATATQPDLAPVYVQHEQAAVAAADGYAKALDYVAPGFAVVTAGPGVTNTLTSLSSAFGDSTPLVVLAGQIKRADIDRFGTRTHGAQEVRSLEIVRPSVKRAVRLSPENARETLIDTAALAMSGRPGPVFIEIPLDVQNHAFAYEAADLEKACDEVRAHIAAARSPSDVLALSAALDWLFQGKRPLLYVGAGCRIARVGAEVVDFAERAGLPLATSWVTADLAPADLPVFIGAPGGMAPISANKALFSADRILFLGARLDLGTTAFQREDFGGQAERTIVDIDDAELAKFEGMAGVATLKADLAALPAALAGRLDAVQDPAWLEGLQAARAEGLAEERSRLVSCELNVYGLANRLSRWAAGRIVIPTGSGAAIETLLRFYEPPKTSRCFFGHALGSMGLGLPTAIGAAMAGVAPVVCLEGDGGLMLTLQELATLRRQAPKGFVLFILNNDGYQSIRASQERHFGGLNGADSESGLFLPDYQAVAAAFELPYRRVETLEALDALLPTLPGDAPPIMIDLKLTRTEQRGPGVKTVIGQDGKITSTSLADIGW